jgi:hypothetical protein
VQSNIASTIGAQWEPIIIDNTINAMPITKVYNLGASKAKYDILCFVHEDVFFDTENWGLKVVESFRQDPALDSSALVVVNIKVKHFQAGFAVSRNWIVVILNI